MNPLVLVAIQQTPAIIALLKDAFRKENPGAPEPTDEQVLAAWSMAFSASLLKDDNWLAAHPE
jgi:hypothetical protein